MSVWDKIIGGAAGFAVGGPLGALLGAIAGHLAGKALIEAPREEDADRTFAVAAIVLGAKMAKSDGSVTREEITAFKRIFRVPREEVGNVARLFDEARKDPTGFEPYARQVAQLFRATPARLEALLEALTRIAAADGAIDPAEVAYLARIAAIFGLDRAVVDRLVRSHDPAASSDPYAALGLTRRASDDELKAAHRRLVRMHHPDRAAAAGDAPDAVARATERLARINDAYDRIRRDRGRKK
ncbi:MAG: TerB family tellurite resistance protein [Alphaproteobacteria bacterium]